MGQVTYTAVIDACVKEAEKSFASPVSAVALRPCQRNSSFLLTRRKGQLAMASSYFQRMVDEGKIKAMLETSTARNPKSCQ